MTAAADLPTARHYGRWNALGVYTLCTREVRRLFKIWPVTFGASTLQALLFATIFSIVIGNDGRASWFGGADNFLAFLLPGLVGAAMMQRAFDAANSIVFDKLEGVIADIVAAPLSPAETLAAYAAAAVTNSLLIGAAVWTALQLFGLGWPANLPLFLMFAVGGAMFVGMIGLLVGIWANNWDRLTAVQTFLFLPIVYLSGVFFSLDQLPAQAQAIAQFNPLHYVIDGIRFGLGGPAFGAGGSGLATGAVLIVVADVAVGGLCYWVLRRGYKLKS